MIYSYDFSENLLKQCINLPETGIAFTDAVFPISNGEFIIQTETDEKPIYLYLQKYNGICDEISIALFDKDQFSDLRQIIAEWNREHPELKVSVIDYSALLGGDEAKITALTSELAEGKVPDMLDLSALPVELLIENQYLMELSDLIPELQQQMPVLKNSLTFNGKIYEVCGSFRLETITASKQFISDSMNWENLISSFAVSGCSYLLDQQKFIPN